MSSNSASAGSIIQPYRSPWGAFPIHHYPENNGSTFALGHIVMQSTRASTASNKIEESPVDSTRIVGVAAAPASSVAGTEIPVWEANPLVEFKAWAKGTLTAENVGNSYGFAYDSTLGIFYVDLTESTVTKVRALITEMLDSTGYVDGWVAFRFRTQDDAEASTRSRVLAYYR